ncbi:MAG: endonuclease domain-containing protein [Brevundimonas sp.]|nr:endonuclease domain-containing protein [Brevundimonas sp.]MBN9467133.1 endonuclease domain-containing protein [Brevundimonas sp.]
MTDAKTYQRAREMRSTLTPPEARLWTALKCQQMGVRFRRQHPIGPYILDFYCASAKLAVEVDGMTHSDPEQAAHDARRTRWLAGRGIRVVRIEAVRVKDDLAAVIDFLHVVLVGR